MIPIGELLNRILWDDEFAQGKFEIGYYDSAENQIVRVAFADVDFDSEVTEFISVNDSDGGVLLVPWHRIRDVYRNGERIWHREH